jgi:hypothetical protein
MFKHFPIRHHGESRKQYEREVAAYKRWLRWEKKRKHHR